MENKYSKIKHKLSSAIDNHKKKMEELYGETARSKSYKKQIIIRIFVTVCFLLSLIINDLYETNKLSKYGVETYSTIYNVLYSIKSSSAGKFRVKCKFKIDGEVYFAQYPINRPLKIGDTLRVLYYPKNPKINKLVLPDSLTTENYNYLEKCYTDK